MKAFTFIHIKAHGFPFTRYITFADNIINHFIKSNKNHNKDQNTSNNIRFIVIQAMHNIYNVIINPTDYVFNNARFTQFWNLRCGYAPSKALPLLEGSLPINTNQPKYENIRKNTKNEKKYEIWTSIKLNAHNSKFRPALPMVASRFDED